MWDNSLEKCCITDSYRPDEEEIAVNESSMTPTSNVKRGCLCKILILFSCLMEYAHNNNRVNWKGSMAQTFLLPPSSISAFIFTQFKSLSYKSFAYYSKLKCQNNEKCIRYLLLHKCKIVFFH